jgi:ribosomal-protein-serine acetyltransferase
MFSWVIDNEIELRMLEVRHAAELFALTNRNRGYLSVWLPWVRMTHEVGDTERFVRSVMGQHAAGDGFSAGIWHRNELCGVIGLHKIDWPNRSVSLGYWVAKDKQGSGIITKATRVVVEYCFHQLDLHRVEIRCGVENQKSQAIPRRLGFRQEGILRQAQWLGDRWTDLLVFSRLATDPPYQGTK